MLPFGVECCLAVRLISELVPMNGAAEHQRTVDFPDEMAQRHAFEKDHKQQESAQQLHAPQHQPKEMHYC